MNSRVVLSSLLFLAIGGTAGDPPAIQSEIIFDGLDRIRISWASEPGEVYSLQSTTNLAEPWQDLETDPSVLLATTNLLAYELVVTNQAQFVRVGWIDSQGPRLIPVYPRFEGIAVPRDSALETRLWDPNGVDSSSIQFSVADRTPIGLGDPRLAYTNQVLTYRPLLGETLGDYGQELNATVVVSDQVGNRSTNLWPFQLELQTILSTNIMVVGGPGGGSPGLANAGGLTLLSRNGLLLMYRYEGASSRLRQGMHLVDSAPGQGYALTVVVFSDDPPTQTVSVWTQPAALADLIEEGSVSTRAARPNPPGGVGQHIWWEPGMDLGFEHTTPLQAILYEWREGENYVRAGLTPASQLDLKVKTGFAANFRNFTLKQFEAYAGGSATLALELSAEGNCQKQYEGSLPLIAPVYEHFVIPVAGLLFEVTTKFEVDLGYDLNFQAQGHVRNGISMSKEIYLGRKWDGQWHDTSRYPPLDFQWSPVEWQVSGTLNARADVKPKMTALVYGLVGPYADLDPYVESEGWGQLNPWQYEWGLYGGLEAHLGCDLTVFDGLFPNLSFEQQYELIPRTLITGGNNLANAPRIVMAPRNRTVAVGETAGFSVAVEGTPPLSYHWQRNGVNLADDGRISGTRSRVLQIANAQVGDAGDYRVVVSNAGGSVTSDEATLTVSGGFVVPAGMVLIPAGTFQMGDTIGDGYSIERPVHTVTLSAFCTDKCEVTKALWDEVYQWAVSRPAELRYSFDNAGSGKAADHPVHRVSWYDTVKWCNARSEREGRVPAYYTSAAQTTVYRTGLVDVQNDWVRWGAGYRLPTEAEWEKAARGRLQGKRFPWGNTISHSQANYNSSSSYSYDVSPTRGYHPTYDAGESPYTSPVGSFGENGYGLYDMAGNLFEWCWDWYGGYGSAAQADPRGPSGGSDRMLRGGDWKNDARGCRVMTRSGSGPGDRYFNVGFRSVLPPGQQGSQAPQITQAPESQTVELGDAIMLSVQATGEEPLRYQWQKNGVDLSNGVRISGSQSSVLQIADAQVTDAGGYRVVVSNAGGSVTSDEATLTVSGGFVVPEGMLLIAAGSFTMGDTFGEGEDDERPVHTVFVSAFYMDETEVTKGLWDEVFQWAIQHGYSFDGSGSGKAADHPVYYVSWYDCVKWCNARSEKEGRVPAYYTSAAQTSVYRTGWVTVHNDWVKWNAGYRLPTEAEWEKAARGGLQGKRFPWGNTISHSQANYNSYWLGGQPWYAGDVSPTEGYHPTFEAGNWPYTSPVGYFAGNGYGLHDVAGNLCEWCWDWHLRAYYGSSPSSDPHGPASGVDRIVRGGGWWYSAPSCQVSSRDYSSQADGYTHIGFRSVLPPGQQGSQAPLITQPPASQTVNLGDAIMLSVQATGEEPLSYQWRKNGVDLVNDVRISGSQSSVLRIADAQVTDGGDYRVVVSNAGGSVTSGAATLTVTGGGGPAPSGMVWIPHGTFTMGSPESEPDSWSDERPQTVVTISKGFWLGKYEVTQREYLAVMGSNPSSFTGDLDRPVEQVSWNDAVAYCQKMTDQEGAAGRLPSGYEYRLPTEAQWEYACRAGTTTATAFGDSLSSTQANFDGNYPYNGGAVGPYLGRTTKVGSYAPNGWGLYDMHGNVWEWCLDWYAGSLPGGSVTDPKGPSSGSYRVSRGGSWGNNGLYCRSAGRYGLYPGFRGVILGFRVALVSVP